MNENPFVQSDIGFAKIKNERLESYYKNAIEELKDSLSGKMKKDNYNYFSDCVSGLIYQDENLRKYEPATKTIDNLYAFMESLVCKNQKAEHPIENGKYYTTDFSNEMIPAKGNIKMRIGNNGRRPGIMFVHHGKNNEKKLDLISLRAAYKSMMGMNGNFSWIRDNIELIDRVSGYLRSDPDYSNVDEAKADLEEMRESLYTWRLPTELPADEVNKIITTIGQLYNKDLFLNNLVEARETFRSIDFGECTDLKKYFSGLVERTLDERLTSLYDDLISRKVTNPEPSPGFNDLSEDVVWLESVKNDIHEEFFEHNENGRLERRMKLLQSLDSEI
jgi:hypothetical protein